MAPVLAALTALLFTVACTQDGSGGGADAGAQPDADVGVCGDGVVNGDEECDDANSREDDTCRSDCRLTCGDGELGENELCDPAIATGSPGACPVECDDEKACTQDALSGAACDQECVYADVTAAVDGDQCCPVGQDSNTDSDCDSVCGNSAVETGEVCDKGITAGEPGACPAECDDSISCTEDSLSNPDTCQAVCGHLQIETKIDSDGCCPAGATIADDNDCSAGCGDGVVSTPGELCDTAISADAEGACPVDCDDGNACTTEQLVSAGTCQAVCSQTGTIASPIHGDGCCPPGANANNDSDCDPKCGNNVVESAEECDDGGVISGDGCSSMCAFEAVAFRFTDLDLRDPHIYVDFLGCRDVTDQELFGFAVNSALQTSIETDDDEDGELDLSFVLQFEPLNPSAATTGMTFTDAICTAPEATTTCEPDLEGTSVSSTAHNDLAPMTPSVCLGPVDSTLGSPAYSPALALPGGPCFASESETLNVSISGIPVVLTDARIAGQYVGSPATNVVSGLIRGFISEEDADATILPDDLALIGGSPLSFVLPGGDPPGLNNTNCSSRDDKDVGPDGVVGWYFYLNFTAEVVPYTP